jgi:hypothetical protein
MVSSPRLLKIASRFSSAALTSPTDNVAIAQGLGELAIASSMSFLRTLSHLSVADPTTNLLDIIRKRYTEVTSHSHADFRWPPILPYDERNPQCILPTRAKRQPDKTTHVQWGDYKPSDHEHTIVADALANLARSISTEVPPKKVPRWTLRFALHSLSQDPLPPTSVIADCLMIVAIDLGIGGLRRWDLRPRTRGGSIVFDEMAVSLT